MTAKLQEFDHAMNNETINRDDGNDAECKAANNKNGTPGNQDKLKQKGKSVHAPTPLACAHSQAASQA